MLNSCAQPTTRLAAVRGSARPPARVRCQPVSASLKALLFDCDGVILERCESPYAGQRRGRRTTGLPAADRCRSEDLHRRAYNAVFKHYNVLVDGKVRDLVQHSSSRLRFLLTHPRHRLLSGVRSTMTCSRTRSAVGNRRCAGAPCLTNSVGGTVPTLPRLGECAPPHANPTVPAGTSARWAGRPARACSTSLV